VFTARLSFAAGRSKVFEVLISVTARETV